MKPLYRAILSMFVVPAVFSAGTAFAQPPRSMTPATLRTSTEAPPSPSAPSTSTVDTKPAPRPLSVSPNDYRLGPGDKLRIEVHKDAQLSQSVQIRPDGKITLPLVGDIQAAGRTPIDLRDGIAAALKEFVINPVVTVIVVEATAATAYIVGEVNHPGVITVQGDMTVLQGLAMAGGLKDFANAKKIRILRKGTAGEQTINFNYKDAINGGGTPVYLRPGDTVVVPD